ncbi:GntR family transcriptional regulator (plasmid) [Embleya sp. NBC_00888]|uniref:GntR family transcriptional regulator n=1 Tax=Embleya sp. NBC_00888 TaxID=2975960 RepID=UPI002F916759|nr:GntR family transcriptional regulator [Embleya sp. NBC_00888]
MVRKDWAEQLPVVKSKADLVYESLRKAIAQGDIAPGERVNMDELARTLGVSKIPIREAVKRLEADGLVVSRVHSGVTVATIDVTEMRGVFLAREAIEALIARLAAEHVTEGLLADLESAQDAMRDALGAGEVVRLPELNSQFHRALALAGGYRILGELTEQLLMTVRRFRITAPMDAGNWRQVVAEHDAILDALRRRDPQAAEDAARTHISSQAAHEVDTDT